LWDEIREKTLASTAPALIHQDSDLIKRAIRDVYNRQIEQILVEGREGFEAAHRFMSMLMPSHAAKVVEYQDNVPLFQRFGVEQQLEGMYQPVVQLKSGGYIVINPTEALVAIDINSGRSTREYGIEETATKTNLEAAEEIGRQLRLRDMAGLVVIDFIDMENSSNVRKVERAMKDAMKNDRARVQIGRISSFGLMEMSRQRLRTGVLEASTHVCPMCEGTGMVRSVASAALAALRALEAEALKGRASEFKLRAGNDVAVYILNKKRIELAELEELYGVTILTVPDENLIGPSFEIDQAGPPPSKRVELSPLPPVVKIEDDPDDLAEEAGEDEDGEPREERRDGRRGDRNKRRRRREREPAETTEADEETGEAVEAAEDVPAEEAEAAPAERGDRKRRRRGRRGKGRANREDAAPEAEALVAPEAPAAEATAETPGRRRRKPVAAKAVDEAAAPVEEAAVEAPAKPARSRRKPKAQAAEAPAAPEVAAPEAPAEDAPAAKPRSRRKPRAEAAPEAPSETSAEEATPAPAPRKGWWQRTFG
jgi:ribonuclease E